MRRFSREEVFWGGLLFVVALVAGSAARWVHVPSDRHAVLLGVLVAVGGVGAWWVTKRPVLGFVAGLGGALWGVPYFTHRGVLALALVPAVACLVPGSWLLERSRVVVGALGGFVAGALLVGLGVGWGLVLVGVVVGALVAFGVPRRPTRGFVRGVRAGGLFVPGVVLVALVGVNAATGWAEASSSVGALWRGVGLAGVLAWLGVAVVGLSVLLESSSRAQASVVVAVAGVVGALVGVVVARDVAGLLGVLAASWVPAWVLVVVAGARVGVEHARVGWWGWGFVVVLGWVQVGVF